MLGFSPLSSASIATLVAQAQAFLQGNAVVNADATGSVTLQAKLIAKADLVANASAQLSDMVETPVVSKNYEVVAAVRKSVATINLKIFPPKDPAEKLWITYTFTPDLQPNESLIGATINAKVRMGSDANFALTLDGDALFTADGRVMQKVKGGVNKAQYLYKCTAQLSSGRVLVLAAALPVRLIY